MKMQYKTPTAKLVDFSYNEQVVATSIPEGVQARPTHPTDCQYSTGRTPPCNQIYVGGVDCLIDPMSLGLEIFYQ